MMKTIRPLAVAVGLALASVSAHAALLTPPAQGATVPANTGLYLEAWNASSGATELVNLSYAYGDIAGTNMDNLNTPNGVAWTSATNPSTGTGTVQQLNFGTIQNASAGAFTNFTVVAAASATQTGVTGFEGTSFGSGSAPVTLTSTTGLNTVVQNIQSEVADWASLTALGTYFDPNGASTAAANTGPSYDGTFNNGAISSGAVGSALDFYNIIGNVSATTRNGVASHATVQSTYNGFWFLTSGGQLTYNIVSSGGGTTPVPLPAAVWLLGSGLLGLIGVGRRNRAAA